MSDPNFWKTRIRQGSVLSPIDRISEVLFGLIMVLTFTGAISVAQSDRNEVRDVLWAALGCNVAWGIVDAVMYIMNVLLERGHSLRALQKIREAEHRETSRAILREEIQPALSALLTDDELDKVTDRVNGIPEPKMGHLMTSGDLKAGVHIFLLVFVCTLPVVIPFAVLDELPLAMRVSNAVALLMLFAGGFRLAQYAGFRTWLTAFAYAMIGVLLVALTMALGG